ncbi:unnamed protein product, partial [Brassica rapa subsp. trilocularis]
VLRFRFWQGFLPLPARLAGEFDGKFGGPKGGLGDGSVGASYKAYLELSFSSAG